MRREVLMPRLSDEVEEGVLVTWFVRPGTPVHEGDLVAEVQVQKVSLDVAAPATGHMAALLTEPGGVVRQGDPIAVIEEAPERAEAALAGTPAPAPPPAEATPGPARPTAPATPAARRLARELGVDLTSIGGSGPDGRIVQADVQAAAERAGGAPEAPAPHLEPITPLRRAIADRLRSGLAATAQLTLTSEADVTDLTDKLQRRSTGQHPALLTAAVVRACALALRDHPRLAARWTDRGLALPADLNIGVAVALDEGLLVPVVRRADSEDLDALGTKIADLAERARTGQLTPAETQGGVFSVTNLGPWGVDAFTPLLNPPQTAVLGVGRARPRPAVRDQAIVPRTLMTLSLTFDHQVVDGAPAAAFLATVTGLLEAPDRIMDS
ncbi:MAG TPA: dihydrolipoamide acetyltransferase family protein [Actinomycetes bacterium]|nr:dihydrolipoamide acetyltransferase family protein [Actinomycetes bacterium]